METWKSIKGYEGIYEVSNLGNVRSLDRTIFYSGFKRKIKGINMLPKKGTGGYHLVILSKKGSPITCAIHRLVCIAFKLNIENKKIVNHIDSDKTNNNVNNLEWVTHRENISHGAKKRETSSKYIGVNWCKTRGKWISAIYFDGKKRYLGSFNNEIDAYTAYLNSIKEHNIENKYAI